MIAQITAEELRARMTDVETYGGTANRFLYALVRQGPPKPSGGNVPGDLFAKYGRELKQGISRTDHLRKVVRTPVAMQAWDDLYRRFYADAPAGMLGAVLARDAARCLRLSLLYAMLQGSDCIKTSHIAAAEAIWKYCRASAAWIFGEVAIAPTVDQVRRAVDEAAERGISRTELHALFGRNIAAHEVTRAVASLVEAGRATERDVRSGGRPKKMVYSTRSRRDGE